MADTPETPPESAPEPAPEPRRERTLTEYLTDPSARRVEWLAVGVLLLFGLFVFVITRSDLVAQSVPVVPEPAEQTVEAEEPVLPRQPYTLADLDLHPDRLYAPYLTGAYLQRSDSASSDATLDDFRTQLDIYQKRMGVDDNFTIRVLDNRTGQTLEVYTLDQMRERYEQTGKASWDQVNAARRTATNQLIRKWVARGIPKPNVAIRWGYASQVAEARERDLPFIEYEIRYARHLGLSLLTTEIGTQETFNQDWLISPVGARGRYQMMPDVLARFDIERYTVPAESGSVEVMEWLHPLISMQGAFLWVRGYANAVGHEIPGVSAYHTGPGNIFHLYGTYLRANAGEDLSEKTVIDAYMWGVTDGFERVRKQSSFGPHSRGYVLSAYGALKAQEDEEIDPDQTIHAEFVQVEPGQRITLRQLLEALEPHDARLDWGPYADASDNPYTRFRALNPHFDLPRSSVEDSLAVPAAGNVTLTNAVNGTAVRFFLPYGSLEVLQRTGQDVLAEEDAFLFDDDAFGDPARTGEMTVYDRAYQQLVEDIAHFGFTGTNQRRLGALYQKFQELAEQDPTPYRVAQARVIGIHRQVWQTQAFRELSGTVANVLGSRESGGAGTPADSASRTTP
ncbi:MAG: hypothetical protein R3362_02775 [Rhodothermales bacterium]|nr:hypothetical protein [Rhodothermales bacterium]